MCPQKAWVTIRKKICHGIQLIITQFFIIMFCEFLGKGPIIEREYVDYTTFNVSTNCRMRIKRSYFKAYNLNFENYFYNYRRCFLT